MLVLSRKKNESIVINDITVTVVEIRGDKVRLGVQAPKDVPVHRREVYEAIHGHHEARDAASGAARHQGDAPAKTPSAGNIERSLHALRRMFRLES